MPFYFTLSNSVIGRLQYIKDDSTTPLTLATFAWDELSRCTSVTYNQISESMTYDFEDKGTGDDDMGNRIEAIDYSDSSMNDYSYLYDKAGNITDKDYGSVTHDYTYDKTYQLKTTDYPGSGDDWTFNYDGVYNRTTTVQNTTTRTYTLDSTSGLNQYSAINNPSVSLDYDDNGNLTDLGDDDIVYNAENRMTSYTSGSDTYTYSYDWAQRRISKTVDSTTTKYIYDGAHVIAEYEGSTLKRKFIYGPGIDWPLMMVDVDGSSQTKYYYYRDAQGSVVALLNNNSSVVEAYSYGPYGQPTVHTAAGNDGIWLTSDDTLSQTAVSGYGNPYMFTARRLDDETGLYYYRARMYSPELGRFLQPDPLGYFDSMNLYQYCLNNSINWADPSGLIKYNPGGPGFPGPIIDTDPSGSDDPGSDSGSKKGCPEGHWPDWLAHGIGAIIDLQIPKIHGFPFPLGIAIIPLLESEAGGEGDCLTPDPNDIPEKPVPIPDCPYPDPSKPEMPQMPGTPPPRPLPC